MEDWSFHAPCLRVKVKTKVGELAVISDPAYLPYWSWEVSGTLYRIFYDSCCIRVMKSVTSKILLYAAEVASNYVSGPCVGAVGAHN